MGKSGIKLGFVFCSRAGDSKQNQVMVPDQQSKPVFSFPTYKACINLNTHILYIFKILEAKKIKNHFSIINVVLNL